MKTDSLILILGGLGLLAYSSKSKTATKPKPTKPTPSSATVSTSTAPVSKPAVIQNNPNSPNPNVTKPSTNSVIDDAGKIIDIASDLPGSFNDVLQPSGSDNPSFDAGDRVQEAYGSTDMGDYAAHLNDDEENSVSVPQDVPAEAVDIPSNGDSSNDFSGNSDFSEQAS